MDVLPVKIDLTEEEIKKCFECDTEDCGTKALDENIFKSPPPSYSFDSVIQKSIWSPYNVFMSKYSDRLKSFKKWPKQLRQSPEELALSGFYYRSEADHVYCFSCGVGIYNWEANDNVNFEHRRHALSCKYLSMISVY